jgi:hypothetical protein
MPKFVGVIENPGDWFVIIEDDAGNRHRLEPIASLALVNHSPDGFSWGYGGSGPAQLALAMLLHVSGDPGLSQRHYQTFKQRHIATLDIDEGWEMPFSRVEEFIEDSRRAEGVRR